ncbi:DUF2690 domain-containing protein [Pimelobacter sp. 30-1]|uniref:DUF2690 domain-containing protein n=1 Tax=Pimelobacter sp. 30-1 TaxID=2004991 RepID=UPI001C03A765|nr:DUF2690 domain-containing protein [Pimelobacter sp. 30-1]
MTGRQPDSATGTRTPRLVGTTAALGLVALLALIFTGLQPAAATSDSRLPSTASFRSGAALAGASYNNKLPYESGCGSGAYVITSKAIMGGTASMVYSPRCQTNWIEWWGPKRLIKKKMVPGFQDNAAGQTAWENDVATWSYSRMLYAPGNTKVTGSFYIFPGTQPTSSQWWQVRCGARCDWIHVN